MGVEGHPGDETRHGELVRPDDLQARTLAIISRVMRRMDEEAQGNYYDLVPEQYRGYVDGLVKNHYPTYREQFGKKTAFRNAMAKNWLAKYMAFPEFAKTEGFDEASSQVSTDAFNESTIACLTGNSSYVLVGHGAYDTEGPGASLRYSRLPLREEPNVKDIEIGSGAHLKDTPRINVPFNFTYETDQSRGSLITSPLIAIYTKPYTPDEPHVMQTIHRSMVIGGGEINRQSGFR